MGRRADVPCCVEEEDLVLWGGWEQRNLLLRRIDPEQGLGKQTWEVWKRGHYTARRASQRRGRGEVGVAMNTLRRLWVMTSHTPRSG